MYVYIYIYMYIYIYIYSEIDFLDTYFRKYDHLTENIKSHT